MNIISYVVNSKLNAVHARWRWIKFGEMLACAACLFACLWLVLQVAAWEGSLTSLTLFYILFFCYIVFGLIAFVLIALASSLRNLGSRDLAQTLEKSCPPLQDRVNTLVYLQEKPRIRLPYFFHTRLEEQASKIIRKEKFPVLLDTNRIKILWGIFFIFLTGILVFEFSVHPFSKLTDKYKLPEKSMPGDSLFELKPQDIVEEKSNTRVWGEVKIIEPGHDVKLTKVDVLPLQIEMATSDPIREPKWVTSLNGGPEIIHHLEAPSEPNYAVYQPLIYLDELQVTDWDVLSYYATAKNAPSTVYTSKIYFVEIRPFHEDLLKGMDGKDGKGKGMKFLNEITGLIKEQTKIIQQTQVHENTTYPKEEMRIQDSHLLTDAEVALALSTNHLFAETVAEGENTPIGEILDHLALAEKAMKFAVSALHDEVIPDGKRHELVALSELIATRKGIQKVMNKGGFAGSDDEDKDQSVTVEESAKKLSQVSEVHHQDKTALAELHQLSLAQEALAGSKAISTQKLNQQKAVQSQLGKLIENNPDLFRGTAQEIEQVQSDMGDALNDLSYGTGQPYLTRAADHMRDLEKAAKINHQEQELGQAYALKKVLDKNIQKLDREKSKPGSLSDKDTKDLAKSSQESADTLKEIVEDGAMGTEHHPLSQALSPENQQALQKALEALAASIPGDSRNQAVGQSSDGLKKISQAFDQGVPKLTREVRLQDQFKLNKHDALDEASQKLISMLNSKKPLSKADEAKAEADLMHNIEVGINSDDAPVGVARKTLFDDAIKALKDNNGLPVDPEKMKKLLDEIEAVRIEANELARKSENKESAQIDPTKFPVSYRDRIQHYYEELSNTPP